jgi:hypothetical protein
MLEGSPNRVVAISVPHRSIHLVHFSALNYAYFRLIKGNSSSYESAMAPKVAATFCHSVISLK